ncbi:hypothetical protein HPB52_006134 [Rhipicephalus sanguineus]|uniref:PiggyBac transposable element-derived protein domain-containing protein n=1 Tax=Rhipicephalus sanguineus TaxID=34632 RepID=A0A9D4SXY5_RHISA|nr:hypothetical protein HPB52_006134 [Rhipicephalus sanguineus]
MEHSGRPRATSEVEDRLITAVIVADLFQSAGDIREVLSLTVSSETRRVNFFDALGPTEAGLASTKLQEPPGQCRRWSTKRVYQDVPQPAVVEEYNRDMGGVDMSERMFSLYPTTQRTKKWTVRTMMFIVRQISLAFADWDKSELTKIFELGEYTTPYVKQVSAARFAVTVADAAPA